MATGSTTKTNQKKSLLHRGFTAVGSISTTQYLPPSQFKVAINNTTPTITKTAMDYVVPLSDGTTCDDGSNTLTGSSGGDNSTDNTSTYKEGAGNTDDTAQNLIANDTNATKIWTIADLASAGADAVGTQPFAIWIYIKDATALAKFKTSGTALEVKIGEDTSNYYSKTWTASDLAVGWNWITSNTTNVNALTETGTVTGDLDTFIIEITTNNATDEFVAGDIVYDLLRQWATTDLVKNLESGYPSVDLDALSMTTRGLVTATQANGFILNGHSTHNEDTSPLIMGEDTTGGESKSRTDELVFVAVDRFI